MILMSHSNKLPSLIFFRRAHFFFDIQKGTSNGYHVTYPERIDGERATRDLSALGKVNYDRYRMKTVSSLTMIMSWQSSFLITILRTTASYF